MSEYARDKDAAWAFMQWASGTEHGLFGAREMDFVNPVRQSVWADEAFRNRIAEVLPGLPRAVRRQRPRLEDLLHAAAAVRGGDDAVGGDLAADGGEGGPGRRGPGPARGQRRRAAPAGRARLRPPERALRSGARASTRASGGDIMATTADMAAPVGHAGVRKSQPHALPYLLSLPALLVCIGILVPFGTAVWYSLQRYNLNLPALRSFIWFDQYSSSSRAGAFWNTVKVSLLYAFFTVGVELLLGLGIALLLRRSTRIQQRAIDSTDAAANGRSRHRVLDVAADDPSRLRHLQLLPRGDRDHDFRLGVRTLLGPVHRRPGRRLGLHALHHDPAARGSALAAAPAVRGGRARRRAGELRLFPASRCRC